MVFTFTAIRFYVVVYKYAHGQSLYLCTASLDGGFDALAHPKHLHFCDKRVHKLLKKKVYMSFSVIFAVKKHTPY